MKLFKIGVWVLCFFCIGALAQSQMTLAHEVYTPNQKDTFVEGGDAWEALNSGSVIILDDNGFIVSELEMQQGDDVEAYAKAIRADIKASERE